MADRPLSVVYLTAGAAGMYCGSCMQDNALAAALVAQRVDIQLVPTYTPIRTDEHNVSVDRVFFSGISIYLQQKIPLFRYLPALFDRLFEQPWLIRWATSGTSDMPPAELGKLTVSMLRGQSGYQRKEVTKLARWLAEEARPDVLHLTNLLIAGALPAIRERRNVPVVVTLQGDDIFLEHLPPKYRTEAIARMRDLASHVDRFLTHSEYYADFMSDYLGLDRGMFQTIPLGLETHDLATALAAEPSLADSPETDSPPPRRIGYLARLAPEKGLHVLVEAFRDLAQRPGFEDVELHVAGWLGGHRQKYAEEQWQSLATAGLQSRYRYWGSVDRHEKFAFLKAIDLLSVPTTYREPKGIFALEAWAVGRPVVLPAHGAFPELIEAGGGGLLCQPDDATDLADRLAELLSDRPRLTALGSAGQAFVLRERNGDAMASAVLQTYRELTGSERIASAAV